jgi:hypothetical protein
VRISEAGSVLIFGEEEDVLVIEKFCTGREWMEKLTVLMTTAARSSDP